MHNQQICTKNQRQRERVCFFIYFLEEQNSQRYTNQPFQKSQPSSPFSSLTSSSSLDSNHHFFVYSHELVPTWFWWSYCGVKSTFIDLKDQRRAQVPTCTFLIYCGNEKEKEKKEFWYGRDQERCWGCGSHNDAFIGDIES